MYLFIVGILFEDITQLHLYVKFENTTGPKHI